MVYGYVRQSRTIVGVFVYKSLVTEVKLTAIHNQVEPMKQFTFIISLKSIKNTRVF